MYREAPNYYQSLKIKQIYLTYSARYSIRSLIINYQANMNVAVICKYWVGLRPECRGTDRLVVEH